MNNTKLQQFSELQPLIRKEIETVSTEIYKKLATQYGVNATPIHYHNGVDLPRISMSDIVRSNKNISGFTADASDTVTVTGINVQNIDRLVLHGFAANNADGSPATKRAIVNGEAQFGRCFNFSGGGTGTVVATTVPSGQPIVQISNAMFTDTASINNTRVSADGTKLVYVTDSTGAIVVSVEITSYTNNSLTFEIVLGSNWKLQSNLIIT